MIKLFADGRLVKDASTFPYGDNKIATKFTLACNRNGNDEEPVYLNCTIWGRNFADYLLQGNQFVIHGDLSERIDDEGRHWMQCNVSEFSFGAKKMR